MFSVYPYSPTTAMIHQTRLETDRVRSIHVNNASNQKEMPEMNSYLHVLEEHVRVVNSQRLVDALKAEQIRLARANQPSGLSKIIANIRSFVGSLLISTGKRMAAEPATGAA
jgi:hypothetical protein